jgi:CheY-like chemotaxis protein
LINAALYTEPGGHVKLAARRDGTSVVIDVIDHGIGIARELLPKVFEIFVQGAERASGPGGLGVGLVVVQQLTQLHGGTVSVVSEGHGRGATFTVRIPVMAPDVCIARPAPAPVLVPTATATKRIMIVDDNEDALELLAETLAKQGHQVATANSGATALALHARFRPAVAVIDIGMPVMNGYELATLVRAAEHGKDVFLVALTGYGQASDRAQALAAGFDEHVVKPVNLRRLLTLLAQ